MNDTATLSPAETTGSAEPLQLEMLRNETAKLENETARLRKEFQSQAWKETLPGHRLGKALAYWCIQALVISLAATTITGLAVLIILLVKTARSWFGG